MSTRHEAQAKAARDLADAIESKDAARVNRASAALNAEHPGAAEELIAEVLATVNRGR